MNSKPLNFTKILIILKIYIKNFFLFRFQQEQLMRRRMAMMNTRTSSVASIQNTPSQSQDSQSGDMSPSAAPSPVSNMGGMGSPHPSGMGMKAGNQQPNTNVLQVLKQVSFEKFTDFLLEMLV